MTEKVSQPWGPGIYGCGTPGQITAPLGPQFPRINSCFPGLLWA